MHQNGCKNSFICLYTYFHCVLAIVQGSINRIGTGSEGWYREIYRKYRTFPKFQLKRRKCHFPQVPRPLYFRAVQNLEIECGDIQIFNFSAHNGYRNSKFWPFSKILRFCAAILARKMKILKIAMSNARARSNLASDEARFSK